MVETGIILENPLTKIFADAKIAIRFRKAAPAPACAVPVEGKLTPQQWAKTLTKEQYLPVEDWLGYRYQYIRAYQLDGVEGLKVAHQSLRNFLPSKEEIERIKNNVKSMIATMKKAPKYSGVSYRGVGWKTVDKAEDFVKEIERNGGITTKAFASSTQDRDIARKFMKGEGKVFLEIEGKSGVDISWLSGGFSGEGPGTRGAELEVLFSKGTKLKFVSKKTISVPALYDRTVQVPATLVKLKEVPKAVPKVIPKPVIPKPVIPKPKPQLTPEQWAKSLTVDEYRAFSKWSLDDFTGIRKYQMNPNASEFKAFLDKRKYVRKQIALMKRGMRTAPVYEGAAYRGMAWKKGDEYKAFLKELERSGGLTTKAFTSSSASSETAAGFLWKENSVLLKIKSKTGRDISFATELGTEKEILFRKGTKFKLVKSEQKIVIDIDRRKIRTTVVTLEEVGKPAATRAVEIGTKMPSATARTTAAVRSPLGRPYDVPAVTVADVPTYHAAKSVKEAERFATEIVRAQSPIEYQSLYRDAASLRKWGKVKYTGLSVDSANHVNQELIRLAKKSDKLKIPRIRSVTTTMPKGRPDALMAMGDGILCVDKKAVNRLMKETPRQILTKKERLAKLIKNRDKVEATFSRLSKELMDLTDKYPTGLGIPPGIKTKMRVLVKRMKPLSGEINYVSKQIMDLQPMTAKQAEKIILNPPIKWKPTDPADLRPQISPRYFEAGQKRVDVMMDHEFGHHIHQQMGLKGGHAHMEDIIRDAVGGRKMTDLGGWKVATKYGEESPYEWFAENYALHVNGRDDLVRNSAKKLFEEFGL